LKNIILSDRLYINEKCILVRKRVDIIMNNEVFISYRSVEADKAYMIKEVLKKNGIGCWMAPESINPGSDYAHAIPDGIQNCKVLLLLLSQQAQESQWVEKEVLAAMEYGKVVIPFAIEKCDVVEPFSFMLRNVQRWDAYEALRDNLERLVKQIHGIVNGNTEEKNLTKIAETVISDELKTVLSLLERTNYADGILELRKLAERGDMEAQYQLGNIYLQGHGVETDYRQAFCLFEEAANSGYLKAACKLGYLYEKGYGTTRNLKKAIDIYEEAALYGVTDACFALGQIYEYGNGVPQSLPKAYGLYEKAYEGYFDMAKQDNVEALCRMGQMCLWGKGVKENHEAAASAYQKAYKLLKERVSTPYAWAQYMLGNILYYDYGVKRNPQEAARWYELAAKMQNADAQYELGKAYFYGEGLEQNYDKAIEWFLKAAEQQNANAQNKLGEMYYSGIGVAQDISTAIRWYELGTMNAEADIQYEIGDRYWYGNEIEKSREKAFEWYEKAFVSYEKKAKKADVAAQCRLGYMYRKGIGVEKNHKNAFKWYEKAALHGDITALCELGNLYYNGSGVMKNYAKAFECYEKASAHGCAEALYMLNIMYEEGHGVARDYDKAKEYRGEAYRLYEIKEDKNARDWYLTVSCARHLYGRDGFEDITYNALKLMEKRAMLACEEAADWGDADAMYMLAEIYRFWVMEADREEMAIKWYEEAANHGDERGQCEMADRYYIGMGVMENRKKAFELYEKSAAQGYSEAMYQLARFHENSNVEEGYETVLEWLEKAAELGNEDALEMLGNYYYAGFGVEINYKKSLSYYRKILESNSSFVEKCKDCATGKQILSAWGIYLLAEMYKEGNGVESNRKKALQYYLKAYWRFWRDKDMHKAAKRHRRKYITYDVSATAEVSVEDKIEKLQKSDYKEGVEEILQLAKKGYADAQYEMGNMYGRGCGRKKNVKKAIWWYQKAAKQGHGKAQNSLGFLYSYGEGVIRNREKAIMWYTKAVQNLETLAEQGDVEAKRELGLMYEGGQGVPEDLQKAFEYYKEAAEQGDALAWYFLGSYYFYRHKNKPLDVAIVCYERSVELGCFVEYSWLAAKYCLSEKYSEYYNEGKAAESYYELAKHGDVQGQYMLGEMYYNGTGVNRNRRLAFEWCKKAAEKGFFFAQYKLGYLYYMGEGTEVDKAQAYKWYRKGVSQSKSLFCIVPEEFADRLQRIRAKNTNEEEIKVENLYWLGGHRLRLYNEIVSMDLV